MQLFWQYHSHSAWYKPLSKFTSQARELEQLTGYLLRASCIATVQLQHRTPDSTMSVVKYNEDLRAPISTSVNDSPKVKVHRVEWAKVMSGDPVEINPSIGSGYKVMSVEEWADRWKTSPEFPECLNCKSHNTKEHAFTQTWCRGKRVWESEILCLDCHKFSWRFYKDPDFKTPEQLEKERWTNLVASTGVMQRSKA